MALRARFRAASAALLPRELPRLAEAYTACGFAGGRGPIRIWEAYTGSPGHDGVLVSTNHRGAPWEGGPSSRDVEKIASLAVAVPGWRDTATACAEVDTSRIRAKEGREERSQHKQAGSGPRAGPRQQVASPLWLPARSHAPPAPGQLCRLRQELWRLGAGAVPPARLLWTEPWAQPLLSHSAARAGKASPTGEAHTAASTARALSVSAPRAAKSAGGATPATPSSAAGATVSSSELAEECDEALEDLSEIRRRAQAAREAVRQGKGVVLASWRLLCAAATKTWSAVLSLRTVLTWDRKEWGARLAQAWKVVRHEAHHYWVGTKLLWADIRISSRLFFKTANGHSLSRRERQQLMRTSADIFRLVPFAVFVIVPFMEFLLPVALRLFPNMLPSTYQNAKQEEAKLKRVLEARLQMAKFLQDTVQEMAKEVKGRREGEVKKTAEELHKFMAKVRTGGKVTNDEILAFASLFNDELTLDNMTRPRLVSMCKYMGLQTFGTDAYLRYILRSRLSWIKEDDKLIESEGVESLSEAELRAACRERGMLGIRDVPSMRQQLQDWLDLALNRSVPSSLLILSRSFLLGGGRLKPEEAVQATLSSLPTKVVEQVGASVPSGDEVLERQRKLQKLQEEEKLIKEELEAEERRRKEEAALAAASPEVALDDRGVEGQASPAPVHAARDSAAPSAPPELALSSGSTHEEGQLQAQEQSKATRDQLCDLSAALAVLASSSAVSKERVDFLRLVNREIELYNSLVEKSGGAEGEEEVMAAYAAAREASEEEATASAKPSRDKGISEALINKVDSMLHQLEKELDRVDAKIGSKTRLLDTDNDGKVTAEEVAAAAALLRDTLGQGQVPELIANLAKDKDGKILVEEIIRLGANHGPMQSTLPQTPPKSSEAKTEARSM